ncbi:MAG TPA: hypothetical protein VJU84_00105 [Pyrinomonadaceae bacterium]|nr:hypothetical protein [Pyrinomonadaceae bacterium]
MTELEDPSRVEEIKQDWEQSRRRYAARPSTLVETLGHVDEEEEADEERACSICDL